MSQQTDAGGLDMDHLEDHYIFRIIIDYYLAKKIY